MRMRFRRNPALPAEAVLVPVGSTVQPITSTRHEQVGVRHQPRPVLQHLGSGDVAAPHCSAARFRRPSGLGTARDEIDLDERIAREPGHADAGPRGKALLGKVGSIDAVHRVVVPLEMR